MCMFFIGSAAEITWLHFIFGVIVFNKKIHGKNRGLQLLLENVSLEE